MKRNVKIKVIVAIVALSVICLSAFIPLALQESKLNGLQQTAIAELNSRSGEYDEQSIVLEDTTKAEAEYLAEKFGAKLRITADGTYAKLTLPVGVTINDVYSERDNRRYLSKMSADYSAKVSDISESDSMRLPASPNYTVSDDAYSLQSYLNYINIGNAWSNSYRGSGVTVAVIDTGIDTDHPEFAGKISEYSYNATEDKIVKDYTNEDGSYDWSLVEDKVGHGTAVAGVIAASMDGSGIVGIAPEVNIIVIKVECNENGEFYRGSDLVFGLYYAIERNVDVVNMSFGGSSNSYAKPAKLAVDSDIICVAAAGNESTASLTYPAADENVIGVGALADNGWELASYSNFGENTNLVAPGTVYTTTLDGGYKTMNGTSFASPIVAAAMALLKQQDSYMEFADVTELLYASCYDIGAIGKDWYFGYGALDIDALICQPRHTVTFDMLTDELDDIKQVFIEGNPLQDIPEPDRNYAVFDGWCYDLECKEDLDWYVDAWQNDITLYARWANEDDAVPYTYVTLPDNTIEIRSYTGHRRFITVPEKIDNKIVSSIGDGAFQNQNRLREVNLPGGLNNIGASAFANCNNLLGIVIPDGVTTVGAYAFYNNVRLQTVSLNNTSKLKTIGDEAFSNSGLLRFDVTAHVEYLNGSAFFGATSLTNINVAKENKNFLSDDGVLYNKTKSTVVSYPAGKSGEYALPNSVTKIGGAAFGYAKLKNIDFNNVTSIDGSAFACSALENVVLTDKITAIGKESFAYCYNLSSLTIGSGLKTLPEKAFLGASSLGSVEIPSNIVSIGGKAFFESGLHALTFAENSQLLEIGGAAFAKCSIQSVVFPQSLFVIGSNAFENNFALNAVEFAENSNLQYIGGSAFMNAVSLKQISLPNKLVSLGGFAFAGSGLTGSVTIPASVTSFGAGTFASCHNLTDIVVENGNTVYEDIDGIVYTIDGKTLVEYPAGNARTEYTVLNGTENIFEDAFYGSHGINYVYLPDSLQEIQREAFYDVENLYTITIPDNVMQISNYAFAECWNLGTVDISDNSKLPRISYATFAYSGINSIRIPAGVSTIAQSAFEGCRNLTSVTFAQNSKLASISAYMFKGADNLQTITFENGSALTSIQAHGLEGMKNLTSVDFGDAKLTNIDNYAFRYCESLQSISIPEGVTYIGRFAFYGDKALSRFDLPTTIDYIGRYAFYGTTDANVYFASEFLPGNLQENWDNGIAGYYVGVTDVLTNGDWKYATLTDGGVSIVKYTGTETSLDLTSLDLGGAIKQIGGYAFYRSGVTQITLPETLNTIQRYAFAYSNLESVTLPANVRFIGQYAFYHTAVASVDISEDSQLAKIEQYAFAQNDNLASITLPSSLEDMGTYAFYGSALTKVNFADGFGMAKIPEYAFADTKLTSVTIPNSVNYIDNSAFRDCLNLQTVNFGTAQDLQLHANAFYNTGLTAVNIPANLRYVGEYALIGLQNLQSYTVEENNPYYKSVDGVLYNKDGKKLIAFPAGRTGSFVVPAFVETIGFGAFENTKLNSVSFEDGINLLTLGYRAFYNAQNLTEVAIPASMVSIDYYAFAECRNLQKVTFAEENKLTGIYEGAFLNCINLSDITIPDSIVEISDFAFYGCTSITKLPISENSAINDIYDYAFAYTGLTELTVPDTVIDIGAYAFRGTPVKKVYISDVQMNTLQIGIGALQDCDVLEDLRIPFTGNAYGGRYCWLGYIFGAGNVGANGAYMPDSLKKLAISQAYDLTWKQIFGTTYDSAKQCNYLSSLEEVVLPEGLPSIENCAFCHCVNLINVVMPSSVTSIGYGAFQYCASLVGVSIPETVTRIENSTFYDCTSLTHIVIPDSVVEICGFAFARCKSLTDVKWGKNIKIIDGSLFCDCSSMQSIEFPANIKIFGGLYFANCDSLRTVTFDENTAFDGYVDFSGSESLEEIDIPYGATEIRDNCFNYCKKLTRVSLPDTVTTIGEAAFCGCGMLSSVSLGASSQLKSVGKWSFATCYSLSDIDLPEGLDSIDDYAFTSCENLKEIVFPASIVSIGQSAFEGCSSLRNVDISSCALTELTTRVFADCFALRNILLPEQLISIGTEAFSDCVNLQEVTLPESLNSIGYWAFNGCSFLQVVTRLGNIDLWAGDSEILRNVKYILDAAGNKTILASVKNFASVDGFRFERRLDETWALIGYDGTSTNVTLPDNINGQSYVISKLRGVESVVIPETITNVESYAFADNIVLQSVVFLGTDTTIESRAFSNCKNLVQVLLPKKLKSIAEGLFVECAKLESVDIPQSVFAIGKCAFWGCSGLSEVVLPVKLFELSEYVFVGCTSLKNIDLPNGLKTIGSGAFRGCTSLEEVNLPAKLESLDDEVFSYCQSLAKITFPQSLKSIGKNVFQECTAVVIDVCSGNENFISENNILYDAQKTKYVYIPDNVTEITIPSSFVEINGLSRNKNIVSVTFEKGSQISEIGEGAFDGCTELRKVEIPDNITRINSSAFGGCTNLTNIVLSENLSYLGNGAFSNCRSLVSVVIPNGVQYIEDYTFSGCTNLEEIVLPDSTVAVGERAFDGCRKLYNIVMNGVKSVGECAFNYCQSLDFVNLPSCESVGKSAFANCTKLCSAVILGSITNIEDSTFEGCESLSNVTLPNTVKSIGNRAFYSCSRLVTVSGIDNVTEIGNEAFESCVQFDMEIPSTIVAIGENAFAASGIKQVVLPEGITTIECGAFASNSLIEVVLPSTLIEIKDGAFANCDNIVKVTNNSSLEILPLSTENGGIGQYAKCIVDKDGNVVYRNFVDNEFELRNFRFVHEYNQWHLVAYVGKEDTVELPQMSAEYIVYEFRGARNIIVPKGVLNHGVNSWTFDRAYVETISFAEDVTYVDNDAFYYFDSLREVTFAAESVDIGGNAFGNCSHLEKINGKKFKFDRGTFYNCSSLKNIEISDGETQLADNLFDGCTSLESIVIPDSVKKIGKGVFNGTKLFKDETNWQNGCLCIGKYLISVDEHCDELVVGENVVIASDAFVNAKKLKRITFGETDSSNLLSGVGNLEALTLSALPDKHNVAAYFGESVPLTLKNVVLKKGCNVTSIDLFNGISGVTIYVEDEKIACPWDDAFPNWNNGNKVYYGGEWINAEFRDANGNVIASDYYTTSQVVRQPYVASVPNGRTKFVFAGWDLDGDGIADPMPATSGKNISATAVMKEVPNAFTVSYLGFDGENLYKQTYVYGDTIVLPDAPQKKGYVFDGWRGFVDGMTVEADISFESKWTHDGSGHVYDVSTVAPTCDEQGYDKHVCSICDHEWHDNFVDALGHNYGDWTLTTAPTCTDEGLQTRTCLTCGHVETQAVAAVGHDFVITVTKAATCTHEGLANYVCATCGHTEVQTIETIEHSYHKHVVPKSWLRMLIEMIANIFFGYEGNDAYYYRCDMCGKVMTSDGVSAMSSSAQSTCIHQSQDWQVTLSPSCQAGLEARICSLCGKAVEVRTTDANGEHVLGDWYVKTAPNCTSTGVERRDCVYCDYFEERELTSLGHDLIHHEGKAATCTENGWNEYDTCSRCDYTTYSEIAAKGHTKDNAVEENRIEATCTVDGHYDSVVYCTVCNEELSRTQVTLQKLGHDMGEWQQTRAPGCSEVGEERRDCSRCDYFETQELAALGHNKGNAVEENRIEATCTVDGHYDSVVYCTVCNEELSRTQVTLQKLGHNLVHHESKAATCTEIGWNEYDTCNRCNYTTYSEIAAKGHTGVVDEAVAPTCTETGLTEGKHCSTCGEVLVAQNVVSALNHDMGEWQQTKAPGCAEVGEERRDCSRCDYFETRELAALGHKKGNAVEENRVETTCTTDGHYDSVVYCTVCNEELSRTQVTLQKLGHNLVHHDGKDATCTEKGWDEYDTCSRCDHTTYSEIAAKGHTEEVDKAVAPTCTETGLTEGKHCSTCGEVLVEQSVVSALGHDMGEWQQIKAPSCTEVGEERRDCSRCDHFETRELAALGHTKGTAVEENRVEATCITDGHYDSVVYCTVCNEELSRTQVTLQKLGHNLVHHDSKAATCTEKGWNEYDTCSRCDYTTYEELPVKGHTKGNAAEENRIEATCTADGHYDSVIYCTVCNEELSRTQVTLSMLGHDLVHHECKAATCMENGWNEYDTCSRCDYTTYNEIAAKGHTEVVDEAVAPTCTETGLTEGRHCSTCGEVLVAQNVESALGHDMGGWQQTKAPGCTEVGEQRRDCSRCEHFETRELAALGHTKGKAVEENRVEATCTTDGHYDSVVYCTVCNEELSRTQVTLQMLGHDLVHHEGKAATCTEKGWDAYDTCSRCDYSTYGEIAALGHTEVVDNAVEPTCTETGLTEGKHCSACGEVLVAQNVVSAIGHSETDWIVDKYATCTEPGSKHKECSVCHEHFATETIDAHGHEFGEWTIVTEPTTKSEGKMTLTCKLCGEQEEKTIDKLPSIGCFGTISTVGGAVATVSILAIVMVVIKKKRKLK